MKVNSELYVTLPKPPGVALTAVCPWIPQRGSPDGTLAAPLRSRFPSKSSVCCVNVRHNSLESIQSLFLSEPKADAFRGHLLDKTPPSTQEKRLVPRARRHSAGDLLLKLDLQI